MSTAGLFRRGSSQLGQQHRGGEPGAARRRPRTAPGGLPGPAAGAGRPNAAAASAEQAASAAARAGRGAVRPRRRPSSTGSSRPRGVTTTRCGRSPQRHLGDGRRYKEIYQLNKDRVQPDGSKLSQASLIRPGWVLEMPADAPRRRPRRDAGRGPATRPTGALRPARRRQGHHGRGRARRRRRRRPAEQGGAGGRRWRPAHGRRRSGTSLRRRPASMATGCSASHGFDLVRSPDRRARCWPPACWPRSAADGAPRCGSRVGRGGAAHGPRTPTGPPADVADALRVGADPDAVNLLDRSLRSRLAPALAAESPHAADRLRGLAHRRQRSAPPARLARREAAGAVAARPGPDVLACCGTDAER